MSLLIRPFQDADLRGLLGVLRLAMPFDPISLPRFTRQVLLDANFRREGALVALVDDEIVGFCLAIARHIPLENALDDTTRGYITLFGVTPAWQRQGIGTALFAEAESYLRASGRDQVLIAPYAPNYFVPGVEVNVYAGALRLLQELGYDEIYRPLAMEASLWNWSPPDWIVERRKLLQMEGVTFEPYSPEATLPLLEFLQTEFPGDWERVARETIGKILGGETPYRLILAREQGRVVGFSHYENERFGPIGVRRSERGRGLGQVLLCMTLEAQATAGLRSAWFLWSDDASAARLYSGAGFQEVRRFALMRKELAPSAAE